MAKLEIDLNRNRIYLINIINNLSATLKLRIDIDRIQIQILTLPHLI